MPKSTSEAYFECAFQYLGAFSKYTKDPTVELPMTIEEFVEFHRGVPGLPPGFDQDSISLEEVRRFAKELLRRARADNPKLGSMDPKLDRNNQILWVSKAHSSAAIKANKGAAMPQRTNAEGVPWKSFLQYFSVLVTLGSLIFSLGILYSTVNNLHSKNEDTRTLADERNTSLKFEIEKHMDEKVGEVNLTISNVRNTIGRVSVDVGHINKNVGDVKTKIEAMNEGLAKVGRDIEAIKGKLVVGQQPERNSAPETGGSVIVSRQ